MAKTAKNLLANGRNNITARANMLGDVQSRVANNTSATNLNAISTPTRPDLTRPVTNLNLQKAQQPVQTRLDNLNNQTLPMQNIQSNTGLGSVAQAPQSRFIGFQNNPTEQPAVEEVGPQGKSFEKLSNNGYIYVPTDTLSARIDNSREEMNYNEKVAALDDLQKDIYKLKRTLTEDEITMYYKELSDDMETIMKLQKELKPIIAKGNMVSTEQLEQKYSQLLSNNVKDVEEVAKKSEEANKTYQNMKKTVDKVLKGNWDGLSADGLKKIRDMDTLVQSTEYAKENYVVGDANDYEIMAYLIKNNAELQKVFNEMKSLQFSDNDKAIIGTKDANKLSKQKYADIDLVANTISDIMGNEQTRATPEQIETAIKGKEALDENYWGNVGKNIKVKSSAVGDSAEKAIYKGDKDLDYYATKLENYVGDKLEIITKPAVEAIIGKKLTDEEYDELVNRKKSKEAAQHELDKQKVDTYFDIVNKTYQNRVDKNLNPDIENYVNNRGMTRMLLQGDMQPFFYKGAGEMAQNAEQPLIIAVSTLNPAAGFVLMGADSFARESTEAYEELRKAGADYDQATQGGYTVGLLSSLVEVGLENVLGGLETTTSDALRDIFMKDFSKKATEMVAKKGLGDILLQGAKTQLWSSLEEGLEEVFQQMIHNREINKYNIDQSLWEGVVEAFEGGFYNPMNFLAGGSDIMSEINKNSDYLKNQAYQGAADAGTMARNVVDTVEGGVNSVKKGIDAVKNKITGKSNIESNTADNTQTENNTQDNGGIIDKITDRGAEKLTSTATAQDKLYKAQEPRMNVLSNKKNLEKRRVKSDRANELIVENGYIPTNTSERLEAHQATLNKLWKIIKDQVNEGKDIVVDQSSIIDALSKYIDEKKSLNIAGIEADIKALEKELKAFKKAQAQGATDLPILENKKQVYNDIVDWKGQEASEVYKGGIRLITAEIGKIEDALISEIPGEFAQQKRDVGALLDAYEDVFKADMKNQRSKGLGITETYSRIEGVGDIIEGALGIFKGEGTKVLKGAGKILLGKSLAKAKNVDFLIKTGFDELSKEMKAKGGAINNTTATPPTNPTTPITPVDNTNNEVTENKPTTPNKPKNKVTSKKSNTTKSQSENNSGKGKRATPNDTQSGIGGNSSSSNGSISKIIEIARDNLLKIDEGGNPYYKVGDKTVTISPKKNHRFSGFRFPANEEYSAFNEKLKDVREGKQKKTTLSTIPGMFSTDNKARGLIIDTEMYEKNSVDHGVIDTTNLLTTANEYEYVVKMGDRDNHINLYKKIPGTDDYFLIGADISKFDGEEYYTITFHEPTRGLTKALENDKANGKEIFEKQSDGTFKVTANGISLNKVTGGKNAVTNKNNKKSETKTEVKEAPKTETKQEENQTKKTEPSEDAKKYLYDKNGNPKNVYHYSTTAFEEFDFNKMRNKLGIYFSPSSRPHGSNYNYKITATIDMNNPLVISPTNKSSMVYPELKKFMERPEGSNDWTYEQRVAYEREQDNKYDARFRELLKQDGYDGVIMLEDNGTVSQYVVLDKEQVHRKSQTQIKKEEKKSEVKKEKPKNKVTAKKTEVTAPKQETKVEQPKVENKTTTTNEGSDLRSKIGDKFYNYMLEQVELTNKTRKGNNGLTGEPLNLKDVTIEDLLPSYIDKFERMAKQEIKEIQKEMDEITKDLPKAPKLTESQKKQLSGITDQNERNKLLKKRQDEWTAKNPIPENIMKKLDELMNRAAEVVEGHKKAKNYLYELKEAEENKEYEDKYSNQEEENKTKVTDNAKNKVTNVKVSKGENVTPDNSGITGKFRNLTLADYNAMKEVEGLEDLYLRGKTKEISDILNLKDATYFFDPADYNGSLEEFNVDFNDYDTLRNAEYFSELQQLLERVRNGETTKQDENNYDDEAGWYTKDEKGNVKRDEEFIKEVQRDHLGDIFRDIDTKALEDIQNKAQELIEKNKMAGEIEENKDNFDALISKYGRWWMQGQEIGQSYQNEIDEENSRIALSQEEAPSDMPTIFEEDLQESNLRNLDENETAQTTDKEAPKNKVTNVKVEKGENTTPDNSSITGRFRNLTREDYQNMQKFGGLEDLYMKGETDKINDLLVLKEAIKKIDPAEYWIDEIESFDLDYYNDFVLLDAEEIVEANRILDKIENGEELTQAEKKDWDDFYDEDKNEWDKARILSFINEATRNLLDKLSPEYVSEGGIEDIVDILREDLGKSKSKYSKDISDLGEVFDDLVERYGAYWRSDGEISEDEISKLNQKKNRKGLIEDTETTSDEDIDMEDVPDEIYEQIAERERAEKRGITDLEDNDMLDIPEEVYDQLAEGEGIKKKTTTEVTGEKNAVTAKQTENERPKNLVTAKIEAENEVKEETPNSEIQIKERGLNTEENDRYSEIRAYFQDLIDDDNARIEKIKNNTLAKSDPAIIESHIKNVENRISKYQEALAMGTDLLEMDRLGAELAAKIEENLKGQKRGGTKYFPVKESKVIENKDGSKVKYLTTTKGDISVQGGLIEVTSPEGVKESFVVQKIGNGPREVRVSGNYMTVDAIQNLIDITNGEYKAPKKSEKSYKIEQTTSASPQEQFMDRFENVYDRDDIKKELSKVEEWEDIVTGKKYKGTKAQRMQFYVDNPLYKIDQESSYGARKYVGVSTDRGESKHYLYGIEYDYAKFLEDNPDIRNKPIEPLTLKQRIEDMAREDGIEMPGEGEEVKYEKLPANVSVREEAKKTGLKRIAPDRVIWQQETFDDGYNNVLKAVNDLSHSIIEEQKYNEYFKKAREEGRRNISDFRTSDGKTIQDMWKLNYNAITDLGFKSRNSQEYNSLIKNIKEANGNEAALKSIAKNLYIKRVSDDIGKHYIYPEAVYEGKPDLLKAKTKFEAYLKGYNTSFSSTDSRIDYSMKDTLGAGVKRQDGNQITKAQKDWILANSLYYGRMFNLDIKKLFSDLGITVVHLNGKNPFLTKGALGVYNPKTKSISVGNGEEKYSVGKGKDKQTKSVATTFGHELTHAIDFMLDKELFSDSQTRPLLHTFNSVVSDRGADYWDSKVEVTARMVEQYLGVEGMGRRDYFRKGGYWNEELYNTYIKPAVESAFKNKLGEYYKEGGSAIPEGFDIDSLIDEAGYDTPNSVTATSKNKVTSK